MTACPQPRVVAGSAIYCKTEGGGWGGVGRAMGLSGFYILCRLLFHSPRLEGGSENILLPDRLSYCRHNSSIYMRVCFIYKRYPHES